MKSQGQVTAWKISINYDFCEIELQLMQSNSCVIEQLFRPLIGQFCAIECLPTVTGKIKFSFTVAQKFLEGYFLKQF